MTTYYNEWDKYAASWLRNLITGGYLPAGDVDERDIRDVKASDLRGYDQCHFFAGIGGWPLALRLAGWPDDRPVWTGSCPCQPFSAAGAQKGHSDERNIWPDWLRLIGECRPTTLFGEQVASAITFGWLDQIFDDLEKETYACAAAVLPACAVGAPHRRDRLWFLADSTRIGSRPGLCENGTQQNGDGIASGGGDGGTMENAEGIGRRAWRPESAGEQGGFGSTGASASCGDVADSVGGLHETERPWGNVWDHEEGIRQDSESQPMVDTIGAGLQRHTGHEYYGDQPGRIGEESHGSVAAANPYWIECPDGKIRPVKPGLRLLANGVPARVGRLRAYGNAIVPQVAAEFIKSCM